MSEQQISFMIAYTVDRMTEFLIEDYQLSIPQALSVIYNAKIYQKLLQTETGLYAQSPSYVYELLEEEHHVQSV